MLPAMARMASTTPTAMPASMITHDHSTPMATIALGAQGEADQRHRQDDRHLEVQVGDECEHDGDGEPDDPCEHRTQEPVVARRGNEPGTEQEPTEGAPQRDDHPHREVAAEAEHGPHRKREQANDDVLHG